MPSADKYDLLVAKDAAFSDVVIDKTGDNALPGNAWESDITLENDTTYYWKVKARSDKTFGAWSAVSVFITEPALPRLYETTLSTTEHSDTAVQTVSTVIVPLANNPQPVTVNVNISPWVMYGGIKMYFGRISAIYLVVNNSFSGSPCCA